jgi:thioredoxin reductase (NADPH)
MHEIVILGSGCAGNTAALYAARANFSPLVLTGHEPGGQLSLTTEVENFPGFLEGVQGPALVETIRRQAERFGATFETGRVTEADLSQKPFRLKIDDDRWTDARSVIIATGASARWLGLPGERQFIGRGYSSCATCDGFFYQDKEIMVVGGGDSAMQEANFLTRFGKHVTLVHRRESFRASKIMQDRVFANPKIDVLTNTVIDEIQDPAAKEVRSVVLRDVRTGRRWEKPVDGLFVAIGHIPNTEPFAGQIELDADGYIISHGGARTSIPGVFHAGDVQDRVYRQAITAAGAGCMAAIEAERYLESTAHA